MEEVTEELVRLSGFAPLIQVWAGICLLFFYEILLKNFPLEKTKRQTKALFDEFSANYQAYIDSDKMPQFESFQGTKWESNFVPTIKNMAGLSFFYSIFILACIGIEGTTMFEARMAAIQILNVAVGVYMLIAILFTRLRLFHTYWTCVIYFFLMIGFYHLFPDFNEWMISHDWIVGEAFTETKTTVMTLFTCVTPLPLIMLHLLYDWAVFMRRKHNLHEINNNFALMTKTIVGLSKPADFPKKLQDKLLKRVKDAVLDRGELKTQDLIEYLTEEIKDEFDAFTSSWLTRRWKKWGHLLKKQKLQIVNMMKTLSLRFPISFH